MSQSIRLITLSCLLAAFSSPAGALEVFGKAGYSKTNVSSEIYAQSVSGATGIAVQLFSGVRLDLRYTVKSEYKNRLAVNDQYTLTNMKTQTNIVSSGIDISLANDKSSLIPFIFLGAGYVEVASNADLTDLNSGETQQINDPKRTGLAGQVGLGLRWRVAKSAAIEVEAYGYSIDFHKAGALLDVYGTAGIRFYL